MPQLTVPSESPALRLFVIFCGLAMLTGPARADEAALRKDTSLQFVPADVSMYSSSLRLKEQWDIVARSQAVK